VKITRTEAGTFFVAAIAVSAAIWRLAFNLGAYQTVFAEHLMVVWIVSIAAIIASVFIGELDEGEPYLPYWGIAILLLPSLWALSEFYFFGDDRVVSMIAFWVLSTLMVVLAMPYVGYLVLQVAVPQALQIRRPRFLFGMFTIAAAVTVAGYLAGDRNDVFMFCQDFDIAGDARPNNCYDPVLGRRIDQPAETGEAAE